MLRILTIAALIIFLGKHVFAQENKKVRVFITVIEGDTRKITPVMACITNLKDSSVHIPPYGDTAGVATYPSPFYTGIPYSSDKNWVGPVRKMKGKGEVNGQRTYVYGNKPTLPYWNEPVMYQTSGDFSIELTPGQWLISLQHGNEYIPVRQVITVTAGKKKIKKTFLLKRWIDLPRYGWYSGDVHVHHALNKPEYMEYLLQMARAEDVHLMNMLEMGDRQNTYFKAGAFGKNSRICREDICLTFGQEEPRSEFGHIIGLNIDTLARDTAFYNHYDLVFSKIHRSPDALVGYAHFAYRGEGVTKGMAFYAPTGQINFVELLQNSQINREEYYDYLNMGFRIAAAAGSDFPWGSTPGDGRTFVYTGYPFSADAWFKGLKQGNTFVSNGPALFLEADGNIPGTELKKSKGDTAHIRARVISHPSIGTISKLQIYHNDGLLIEKNNETKSDSIEIQFSYALQKSQWLTAYAYTDNGALAHTSPVYIIIDGQPVFDQVKGPEVAKKLLEIIEATRLEELAKPQVDEGIIERLEKARLFYNEMLRG